MKTVVFTIASKNYFAYVRTIMQSLEASNPHMDRYAVVVDDLDDEFVALPRNFELLELDRLDLPHPNCFKFRYDIMEFNTAVKPYAILKLFETYDRVIYLDPDIYVYKRLEPVEMALDAGNNFVFTPHFNGLFEDDGMHPDEPDIMRAGVYNLGFIALNKCTDALEMVKWWADKLEYQCINEQEKGIFVDQKWMDLVPGYYKNVCILHDSGLNVAYWNVSHREIVKRGSDYFVNGDPLIFFHFSGLNPNNINVVSKHQNRFVLADLGDGAELFENYAKTVLSNDFDMWKKFKYSYNKFSDGRPVLNEHRIKYRRDINMQGYCGENPFEYGWLFYGERDMELQSHGVNLIGYLYSEHGVGEAARLTANCLEAVGENWCGYDFEVGNPCKKNDKTFKDRIKNYIKYDISIINVNADQIPVLKQNTPEKLWDTYKIGVWYWELPEFPEQWMKSFFDVDEIWAPTKYVADCLQKCAPCSVYHMPPGIVRQEPDKTVYNRAYFALPEDAFLFLNMFDVYSFSGRKNPEAAVKAFQDAFAPDDMSVGLVLKLNNSNYNDADRDKLKNLIGAHKNIYIIAKTMPRDAVNGLLNICDAAVSLHRSEGLGLLCEEAMFYGKPVIATAWSGNMDFMTKDCACLVDYDIVPVGEDIGPYAAWQEWADPKVNQAAEYMKRLISDKGYYNMLSEAAKSYIRNEFSPQVCGKRMKKRLEQIRNETDKASCNKERSAAVMARICLPCYQRLMEKNFSMAEKNQLVSVWTQKGTVNFNRIAEDISKSSLLKKSNDREFVSILYKNILGRTPSDEETNIWINQLVVLGREQVIAAFLKSEEFMGSYAAIYQESLKDSKIRNVVHKWKERNHYLEKPNPTEIEKTDGRSVDTGRGGDLSSEMGSLDSVMAEELRNLNSVYDVKYYNELSRGKLTAFIQKIVRRINRFLLMPVISQQVEFNAHVVRYLNAFQQKMSLINESNRKIEDLEQNFDALDKLLTEIKDQSNTDNMELKKQLDNVSKDMKEQLADCVKQINVHSDSRENTLIEVEGSRHNQIVHYLMELIDYEKNRETGDQGTDSECLKEAIKEKWALVDSYEEKQSAHKIDCPICGSQMETDKVRKLESDCIFGGGKLVRMVCPKCGVTFGPEKMFRLDDRAFSADYKMHYSVYKEGDSTEQEIEVFKKLNPDKEGIYLDWGVGAWSAVISSLREEGYQIYGYDPYAPVDSEFVLTREEQLNAMKFDGIFSHDLLEHLKDPLATFQLFAKILKPGGKMVHSTACYDYVYEYTRFHLFFYTGTAIEELCKRTGFVVDSIERDPINLLITYTYSLENQ